MISRENYQYIAAVFRRTRPDKPKGYKYNQWLLDREALITYFVTDNPNFDPLQFRTATEIRRDY